MGPKERKPRLKAKRTKVKICGITRLEDALFAQGSGADALGFVFYHLSPRYIRPDNAKTIISHLKNKIVKIGVFVNPKASEVKKIAELCRLDVLQFHGDETPDFCRQFPSYKVIKAFRVKDKDSLGGLSDYRGVDYYLFDAFSQKGLGGTGRKFNWELLKKAKIDKPFFLSGGLTPKNVVSAIKTVFPSWVDVSSGVEKSPGIKDQKKMKDFIYSANVPLPLREGPGEGE